VTTPISGTVCRPYRPGLAMINRHTKFEVATITCNVAIRFFLLTRFSAVWSGTLEQHFNW